MGGTDGLARVACVLWVAHGSRAAASTGVHANPSNENFEPLYVNAFCSTWHVPRVGGEAETIFDFRIRNGEETREVARRRSREETRLERCTER